MGWETVEVEHDEFVSKKSKEKVLICDSCGMETYKSDRVLFYAENHNIEDLHVCHDCIDGDVPLSAHSAKAYPSNRKVMVTQLKDDTGMFLFLIIFGMCLGFNILWFV